MQGNIWFNVISCFLFNVYVINFYTMIVAYHTARMNDDWEVACSDEEDSPSYMPTPETIVDLYNRIDKGEVSLLILVGNFFYFSTGSFLHTLKYN